MASNYYNLQEWQVPQRQASWDQPPPSRSGASSVTSREEPVAFAPQFEEVDRAIDNLMKSGKLITRGSPMGSMSGRPFAGEFDPRQNSRPQSMDFDPMRGGHGNHLQNYFGNARYPPRAAEGDQMQQVKRRMAAQRERELRNYHQEQQYNRSMSSQGKSDRSASPSTMNDEDRRDLLARQHKALYGEPGFGFGDDSQTPRQGNPMMAPGTTSGYEDKISSQDARSVTESNTSPAIGANNFGTFEQAAAQQTSRTTASSPGGSPPRPGKASAAPGAIGTRPTGNPSLSKRPTPPAASPLGFGFEAGSQAERAGSAASNPPSGRDSMTSSGNWGSSSGVWGKSSLGGVSNSVWA